MIGLAQLTEPSNAERADWPTATCSYVTGLEDALADKDAELSALQGALKLAIGHIEHMAAWIGLTNRGDAQGLYSFEALGEDMAGIKAALAAACPSSGNAAPTPTPTQDAHRSAMAQCGILPPHHDPLCASAGPCVLAEGHDGPHLCRTQAGPRYWASDDDCDCCDVTDPDRCITWSDTSPTHQHVKRGTTYWLLGEAELQVATATPKEGDALIVYRDKDDKLWARAKPEFEDGRFIALAEEEQFAKNAKKSPSLARKLRSAVVLLLETDGTPTLKVWDPAGEILALWIDESAQGDRVYEQTHREPEISTLMELIGADHIGNAGDGYLDDQTVQAIRAMHWRRDGGQLAAVEEQADE